MWPPADAREDFDSMVPEHIREGLTAYVERGRPTGDFLAAVLGNDLFDAARLADAMNARYLTRIALFLIWHAPHGAIGSAERVRGWIERGGLAANTESTSVDAPPPPVD